MAPTQKKKLRETASYASRTQQGRFRETRHAREERMPGSYEREDSSRQRPSAGTDSIKGPLTVLAILAVLVCAVLLGWNYFTIQQVDISGNVALNRDDIFTLSGIRLDENMFMLDTRLVGERLETNPYIEVLSVKRVYPHTVSIEIFERSAKAAIAMTGRYAIIGDDNIVLDVNSTLPDGQFPVVSEMEVSQFQPGSVIASDETEKFRIMNQLLTALYDSGAVEWIGEINLKDPQNVVILSREGIYILVGELKNLEEKFKLLDQIMPSIRQEGYQAGKIYLTRDSVNFVPAEASDGQESP